MHHLLFAESNNRLQEKRGFGFFAKKPIFDLKHQEHIINTLINLFMASNNLKKTS
jgi:hypothetical protein